MPSDRVSYQESGYFSALIVDYLNAEQSLAHLYNRGADLENFKLQIEEKSTNFKGDRNTLRDVLMRQYKKTAASEQTLINIENLANANCFTVTTGHQLNLFTGPLYFLYKIITAINLAKKLKQRFPDNDFVPVYWMATEDHDFDEISYFNFHGKKFKWPRESSGAVGRLSTEGIEAVLKLFSAEAGIGENAKNLSALFADAYLKHTNLTDATRFLANELFSRHGLVIIDGDDRDLKNMFAPFIQREVKENFSFNAVTETISGFAYDVQVNPREINLFYLEDGLRERIIRDDGKFKINNTDRDFSEGELMHEIDQNPERFSPNVILRPLYQEVILPNLCYIGGGGELAYWFELKKMFDTAGVAFPILMLRNSVLIATEKQSAKADKLNLEWRDLFLPADKLSDLLAKRKSKIPTDFSLLKSQLTAQFDALREAASTTDISFATALSAQERKQLKGIENLEKKFWRAERKHFADEISRALELRESLFPMGQLQERVTNFSEFFSEYGDIVPQLIEALDPFSDEFTIVELN